MSTHDYLRKHPPIVGSYAEKFVRNTEKGVNISRGLQLWFKTAEHKEEAKLYEQAHHTGPARHVKTGPFPGLQVDDEPPAKVGRKRAGRGGTKTETRRGGKTKEVETGDA